MSYTIMIFLLISVFIADGLIIYTVYKVNKTNYEQRKKIFNSLGYRIIEAKSKEHKSIIKIFEKVRNIPVLLLRFDFIVELSHGSYFFEVVANQKNPAPYTYGILEMIPDELQNFPDFAISKRSLFGKLYTKTQDPFLRDYKLYPEEMFGMLVNSSIYEDLKNLFSKNAGKQVKKFGEYVAYYETLSKSIKIENLYDKLQEFEQFKKNFLELISQMNLEKPKLES
ncbi:MAG: hypothetical protein N2Z58_07150 [Fervidobacterium sp.]|nr:hypothetical protein [Fervidobacterium sp.]